LRRAGWAWLGLVWLSEFGRVGLGWVGPGWVVSGGIGFELLCLGHSGSGCVRLGGLGCFRWLAWLVWFGWINWRGGLSCRCSVAAVWLGFVASSRLYFVWLGRFGRPSWRGPRLIWFTRPAWLFCLFCLVKLVLLVGLAWLMCFVWCALVRRISSMCLEWFCLVGFIGPLF